MLIPDNWGELLLPGLRVIFDMMMKPKKNMRAELFNVQKSTKAQEFNQGIGELGMLQPWTGRTHFEDFSKGFKSTYTHAKWNLGIQIQCELLQDDQYGEIKKRVQKLAGSAHYTLQYHAASVFNNAFNAAYVGPDLVPLCSLYHPVGPSAVTYRENAFSYELDADNLEKIRTHMMTKWLDDKANLMTINPEDLILFVPPNLRKKALVIADTEGEPDTSENNINIWHGAIDVVEWQFLTDPDAWFVLERERMKQYLNWYDRRPLDFSDYFDWDTEVSQYRTITRYSYGWDSETWICGSNPS